MFRNTSNRASDLKGITRLTTDAVIGVTDLTEALHFTITKFGGLLTAPDQKRTSGITGLAYWNVRTITKLVAGGLDVLLSQLSPLLEEKESSPEREASLSGLNGVVGNYLVAKDNPLAITMQLRRDGIALNEQSLSTAIQQANGKVVLLIHGLCMNDLQWTRPEHDYGAALAQELGFLPLYVRYNSGLHVSENGRELADLLETVAIQSPQPLDLHIVAHSMGGLVARSACYYGESADHVWLTNLRKIVFLGTPHHGAPLEKGGNWIDMLLGINPYSAPFARLGKIRSSGITDLRYGNVVDQDWQGRDRFKLSRDPRVPVPLPDGVPCFAIAATTADDPTRLFDDLVGDGLVPVKSALGQHRKAERQLLFPESQQWIGRNMNHIDLLGHPDVYAMIKLWLTD
jgi:pimeloyl-ACP methyl ester carboxylesterase